MKSLAIYLLIFGTVVFALQPRIRNREHSLDSYKSNPDIPSRLFFEGLYLGFSLTPLSSTIAKVNNSNTNLAQLDDAFDVLGKSMMYPEKYPEAINELHSFFAGLNTSLQPLDDNAQYIINSFLSAFESVEIFKAKCAKSYIINEISPLLFFWDAQDLYPYGMFQDYGKTLAHVIQLMIFQDE